MPENASQDHDNGDGEEDPVAITNAFVSVNVHLKANGASGLQDDHKEGGTYKRAGSRWICCSTGPAMVGGLCIETRYACLQSVAWMGWSERSHATLVVDAKKFAATRDGVASMASLLL